MQRLSGRIAIITGAAQGMGEVHARRFVAEGANVVMTDVQRDVGEALAAELGPRARFLSHDVTDAGAWDRVLEHTRGTFGGVDVLVNNAAVYAVQPVEEFEPDTVRRLLEVNLFGVWLGMRAVIPVMRRGGGGSIINVSSLAGYRGYPGHAIYGASKWALRGLTRTAAAELGPAGIRVNCILPGPIDETGMFDTRIHDMSETIAAIPLRRAGKREEVANLVVFLASDESSFITGADHVIDGGRSLY
jgi:3alpha(or 20beta)-hydroxysteroid dehydrogenase